MKKISFIGLFFAVFLLGTQQNSASTPSITVEDKCGMAFHTSNETDYLPLVFTLKETGPAITNAKRRCNKKTTHTMPPRIKNSGKFYLPESPTCGYSIEHYNVFMGNHIKTNTCAVNPGDHVTFTLTGLPKGVDPSNLPQSASHDLSKLGCDCKIEKH